MGEARGERGVNVGMVGRVLIGSAVLAIIGAGVLLATGHGRLVVPALGGVVWGMLNLLFLRRVITHLRPDRSVAAGRLVIDVAVKFPLMYVLAFLLLRTRPIEEIVAAAVGFALVLVVMFLRALGALLFSRSTPDSRSTQGA